MKDSTEDDNNVPKAPMFSMAAWGAEDKAFDFENAGQSFPT
jgi:hypothetical protein